MLYIEKSLITRNIIVNATVWLEKTYISISFNTKTAIKWQRSSVATMYSTYKYNAFNSYEAFTIQQNHAESHQY